MLSNGYVTDILNDIRAHCYVSLHFDNPSTAGAYASEVSGGGYSRILGSFTEPSSRTIWNSEAMTFSGLLSTRITHVCGWNEQKQGDLLWSAQLTEPLNIRQGGGYTFVAGDIAVSLA